MGMIYIYAIFFFIIISVVGIAIFINSIRNKSIFGYIISFFIFLFVIMFLLSNSIDESSITKNDVKNDLKYFEVELIDNFEIKTNIVRGFPERIQETEIVITNKDKEKIISEIKKTSSLNSYDFSPISYTGDEEFDSVYKISNLEPPYFYYQIKTIKRVNGLFTRFHLILRNNSNIIEYSKFEK